MLRAALAYWAPVFALGFVLGTLRVMWLEGVAGAVGAVLLEVPVMLAASCVAARIVLRRFAIAGRARAFAVGGAGFVLLMASEAVLAAWLGAGVSEWLSGMTGAAGLVGLAGQVGFALMPGLVYRRPSPGPL